MGCALLNKFVAESPLPATKAAAPLFPDAEWRDMPAEAPLEMPIQSFGAQPQPGRRVVTSPEGMSERRLLLVLGALAIGLLGATEMARPLRADGLSLLDAAMFLLFFSLFCWISFGFFNAVAGFFVLLGQRGRPDPAALPAAMPRKRTAVLIPIYNEEIDALFARLRTMTGLVGETGAGAMFDFFVLSDSPAARQEAEFTAFAAVRDASPVAVHYRRRPQNVARKPGNIADWVRGFGGDYDYMIVLDADSLMSGSAMVRLAAMMDRSPGVGLIQTVPTLINARTLFARWQQFAAAAYGPIATAGLMWWSGSEATFWGHNAIVRVRAFAESCGLPALPGREPFGGHVMSHDMVEAALLRRRGWAVHMIAPAEGSHEEFPPTLTDLAVRDRRWCQGNLQHLRLMNSAGFHWVSRLQLLMGASAYLTSPLWLLLTLATALYMLGLATAPGFSGWPLLLTAVLLLVPKALSFVWLMLDRDRRARLGGTGRILRSMAVELPLSILIAPLMMLGQTIAIVDIVRGRASGWSAQRREADGIPLRAALRDYRVHLALGLLILATALAGVDGVLWLLPIMAGLVAAPLIAALTSRRDVGDWLAARGIFPSPSTLAVAEAPLAPEIERAAEAGFVIRLTASNPVDAVLPGVAAAGAHIARR